MQWSPSNLRHLLFPVERTGSSSLYQRETYTRTPAAHHDASVQPFCERSRQIECLRTIFTRSKSQMSLFLCSTHTVLEKVGLWKFPLGGAMNDFWHYTIVILRSYFSMPHPSVETCCASRYMGRPLLTLWPRWSRKCPWRRIKLSLILEVVGYSVWTAYTSA